MANVTIDGAIVRDLREKSGLSQLGGARTMGIDRKTLWRIERSVEPITVIASIARSIAEALDVPVDSLAPQAGGPAREGKPPAPPAE